RRIVDAGVCVPGELLLLAVIEIEDPEARQRRLRLTRLHRELLLGARAVVAIDAVGGDEIDLSPVGRELPVAHAGRVTRELGDVWIAPEVGDVDGVDGLVA